MKTLNLKCAKCGRGIFYCGNNVDEIIQKIDAAGWGGCDDICPDCLRDLPDASCDPE